MSRFKRSCMQTILALAAFATFAQWAPWLGAKPLFELAYMELQHRAIPNDAHSFSISHGDVVFHHHGTIADQPIEFMLYTLLLAFVGLMVWLSKSRSG